MKYIVDADTLRTKHTLARGIWGMSPQKNFENKCVEIDSEAIWSYFYKGHIYNILEQFDKILDLFKQKNRCILL